MFFISAESKTLSPTIISKFDPSEAIIDVQSSIGSTYSIIQDSTYIESLIRVNEMFSFTLTTSVALTHIEAVQTGVQMAYATLLDVDASMLEISINSIDEFLVAG